MECGNDSRLIYLNALTGKIIAPATPNVPGDELWFNPGDDLIYAANNDTNVLNVVNPQTHKVIQSLSDVGGRNQAAFAENKVAGFAMFKFLNSLLFIPIVAFFLPGNWQLLAGFLSPFCPLKVFWLAAQGQSYWPFLLAGLLVNLITLMLLLQRFQKVVHR